MAPGPGPCDRVSMNRNTFSTGEYWYTETNDIFVRSVNIQIGEPGEVIWTVEDKAISLCSLYMIHQGLMP